MLNERVHNNAWMCGKQWKYQVMGQMAKVCYIYEFIPLWVPKETEFIESSRSNFLLRCRMPLAVNASDPVTNERGVEVTLAASRQAWGQWHSHEPREVLGSREAIWEYRWGKIGSSMHSELALGLLNGRTGLRGWIITFYVERKNKI